MKGVFNRMVATRYQEAQLIMVEMKEIGKKCSYIFQYIGGLRLQGHTTHEEDSVGSALPNVTQDYALVSHNYEGCFQQDGCKKISRSTTDYGENERDEGYEIYQYSKLIAVFSAPNYSDQFEEEWNRKEAWECVLNFSVVGVVDYEMLEERLMDFCQEILIFDVISGLIAAKKDTYKMDEDEPSMHFEEAQAVVLFAYDLENKEVRPGALPCVLSALRIISHVTLRQASSSGGTEDLKFFCYLKTFTPSEFGGVTSREGGMSIALSSPDVRVVGGLLGGILTASVHVHVPFPL
ncbi:AT-hook motif nuclear-localized protein 1-like protein [Tanacetum coccineum]